MLQHTDCHSTEYVERLIDFHTSKNEYLNLFLIGYDSVLHKTNICMHNGFLDNYIDNH